MVQDVVQTTQGNASKAVQEVRQRLKRDPSQYNAIIFFASSSYNFEELSAELYKAFPKAEVIGASTSGEITATGFTKNSLVVNAIMDSRTRFKGVLVDDADKFPVVHRAAIDKAASSIGINFASQAISRDSFAISLICGLLNAEEGILSLLYSLIKDPNFLVAGGSAGDDLQFKATYVSYNGKASSRGGVFLFVKTDCRFGIYKENIFQRSGKSVRLTSVQPETHIVRGIDGKNPRMRYAEILGISENKVADAILEHPFGRVFGDNVFIASLVQFDKDGILSMYARVLQDSVQEILEPMDAIAVSEATCRKITQDIPNPKCVILFNCILRTIGFNKNGQSQAINSIWNKYFPVYSGFSTYGEQLGHINSNQTLVSLVMGD